MTTVLAERMLALLRPGDTIWWGQAMAEPLTLTRALVEQRHAIARGGRLRIFASYGASDTLQPAHADVFDFSGCIAGGTHRRLTAAGVFDIYPGHYSQVPGFIRADVLAADVALVQVSPPDERGRYSLGMIQEYLPAVLEKARVVIGEVNPVIPWTQGDAFLKAENFELLVDAKHPPLDAERADPGPVEWSIARQVASQIQNGATLQVGIGKIPESVLSLLHDRRDLGLHSGTAGDGIVALAEAGVLTNTRKGRDMGVNITGILMGTQTLRRWAHRNQQLALRGTEYTHDPAVLASLNQLVAINGAIEVDLTGQVNSEVAGGVYVGGVGGAVDFLRGAARSRGGLPVVALPSTAKGATRIVAQLSGPVSTTRSDAGLIVTEHGVADLRGLPLSRRVQSMIDIAAPEHRADLDRQAHELLRRCGAGFFPLNK